MSEGSLQYAMSRYRIVGVLKRGYSRKAKTIEHSMVPAKLLEGSEQTAWISLRASI